MDSQGNSGLPSKSKKIYFIIGGLVLAVLLLGGVLLWIFLKQGPPQEQKQAGGKGTVVTEDNVEEVRKQLAEPVADGYYTTSMSVDWTFENGTAVSSDAYVVNAEDNTRTVYFDMKLKDTKELIYTSPYLPVGAELKDIKLDKSLPVGDYETVLTYHLVDDEQKEISTVSVTVTIHILN